MEVRSGKGAAMIPTKPATLAQRVIVQHLSSGHALVILRNIDGTWRDAFLMHNLNLSRGMK